MTNNLESDYKPSSEWKEETLERRKEIAGFLKRYTDEVLSGIDARQRYDGFSDLHFSGSNLKVMDEIKNGSAVVDVINVLYENGKPTQIHIVFNGEGHGHNIDAYLTNRALADFLEGK